MVWRCRLPERRGLRHHSAPAGGCRGNGAAAMEGGGRPSAAQAVLLVASTALTALVYSVYRQKARVARGLEVGCDGPPGRGGGGGVWVSRRGPGPHRGLVSSVERRPPFLPRRAPGGSGWTETCGRCCWRRRDAASPTRSSKVGARPKSQGGGVYPHPGCPLAGLVLSPAPRFCSQQLISSLSGSLFSLPSRSDTAPTRCMP